jgi:transcriptional regulator with XRE-family HTH domain
MIPTMPRRPKIKLPPLDFGEEILGQRLARLRKARGHTQTELAEKIGTIQALVSDDERDKLRLNADVAIRVAQALEISTDELLALRPASVVDKKPRRRILNRLKQIESLPPHQQSFLLKTIDPLLRGTQRA